MDKDLPIEYTPLSLSNLGVGTEFGPLEYIVRSETHEKARRLLEESDLNQETRITTPYLFPSEMWAYARIFSTYFGRLNEIAVSRTTWRILGKALPGQKLTARSKVTNTQTRNNLPFATAETVTQDVTGKTLIHCVDELLLLHDVDFPFYQERAKETPLPKNPTYERMRKVYFRHMWDNGKWINNIHTDEYARRFGYERGLPEFIMYMDWIFLSQLEPYGERAYSNTTIELRKILPIYKDETIKITGNEGTQHQVVQFFRGKQERLNALILAGM